MNICKYCKKPFDLSNKPHGWMASHTRWCDANPKYDEYRRKLCEARRFITKESIKKQAMAITRLHEEGHYKNKKIVKPFLGKHHTLESKQKIKIAALASNHRRLKKKPQLYKGILMDSTWEVELAKRLDNIKVKWYRPDPLVWIDERNLKHHYFPDFYLPEYNLYIDPKNPYAFKMQITKIKTLQQQYKNIIFLTEINKIRQFTPAPVLALPSKQ